MVVVMVLILLADLVDQVEAHLIIMVLLLAQQYLVKEMLVEQFLLLDHQIMVLQVVEVLAVRVEMEVLQ